MSVGEKLRVRRVLERFQLLGKVGLKWRLGRVGGRDSVATRTGAVATVATGSGAHHIVHGDVNWSRGSGRASLLLHRPRRQRRYLSAVAHERDDTVAHLFKLFRFGVSDSFAGNFFKLVLLFSRVLTGSSKVNRADFIIKVSPEVNR